MEKSGNKEMGDMTEGSCAHILRRAKSDLNLTNLRDIVYRIRRFYKGDPKLKTRSSVDKLSQGGKSLVSGYKD